MPTDIPPLDGRTTTDDKMQFQPERLSYQSATKAAKRIADHVQTGVKDKDVIVGGTRYVADLNTLRSAVAVLENLVQDYAKLADAGERMSARTREPEVVGDGGGHSLEAMHLPAGRALTAAVQTGLTLASLFRQDVEYQGQSQVLDAIAIELELAVHLKRGGARNVYVPDLTIVPPVDPEMSPLYSRLRIAHGERARCWSAMAPLSARLALLEAGLDDAARRKDEPAVAAAMASIQALRRDLDPIATPLARVDQRFNELESTLSQASASDNGLTVLARLFRVEYLASVAGLHLHVQVLSAGGHNRIVRSLLRTMFTGDGLSSTGGVVVSWAILNDTGAVIDGSLVTVTERQ